MKSSYMLSLCLILCAFSARAQFANSDYIPMKWQSSLHAACSEAQSGKLPVLVTVIRANVPTDQKLVDKLASWPQCVELTKNSKMAAYQMRDDSADAKELLTRMGQKAPTVLFLDHNGNPMAGIPWPEQAASITAVVAGWPSLMMQVEKFIKEHQDKGERYLTKGKLKEAYLEFSCAAPFKGTGSDKARTGQAQVKEHWQKLFNEALKLPPESIGRTAIFSGLRRETFGTDYYDEMELSISKSGFAVAKVETPNTPAKKEAPKSLAEAARSSPSVASARSDDDSSPVEANFLLSRNDAKLKEANALLSEGVADYRKAIADNMERGPARNKLLQNAHEKFEKTLTILEAATKGDAQIEKLMERTSMLMYGTLKYQSL